jgi:putative membrane protein
MMGKKVLNALFVGFPFVVLDSWHMMEDWGHMMGLQGVPFMGYWILLIWIAQLILAVLVYSDAKKRGKNSLLWFLLVILPLLGLLFLVGYLVVRGEEQETKDALKEAKKILDERYAKGEITRAEYLQMQRDIQHKQEEHNE